MFLNPSILFLGVLGAAVPLLVHLLSRWRYRDVDWGAMMFLEAGRPAYQHRARLRQIVLLLLRMGIVGLLAIALARPVLSGAWGLSGGGKLTAVILLDRSASMGYDEHGRSRMDLARQAVVQVLSSLQKGDEVAFLWMGDQTPEALTRPSSDLQARAADVRRLDESFGQADIAQALHSAMEILDRHSAQSRAIYIICDRQALSWRNVDGPFVAAWQSRREQSPSPTTLLVVPVGTDEAENLAIEAVEVLNPPVIRGQSSEVEVRARNYSSTLRSAVPVQLYLGSDRSSPVHSVPITLAPHSVQSVRATLRFSRPGSQVIAAALATRGLSSDNAMACAVEVVEPVRMLIVSGSQSGGLFRGEADFFKLALAPFQAVGRKGPDAAQVRILAADDRGWESHLAGNQVVVLANVPQIELTHVKALEQFVYGGGGVLIAPGNLCRVENYNTMLYRDGAGVLPAPLQPATPADGSRSTSLLGLDLDHPIFRFLKGRPPVPTATISRFFPVSAPPQARLIATYASGEPFLVESAAGRGRVLLMTTPLDLDWGTLPLSPFYLPYVQSLARYLAAGTVADRNLAPGELIEAVLDGQIESAILHLPDRSRQLPLEIDRSLSRPAIRYTDTNQPGEYVLNVTRPDGSLIREKLRAYQKDHGRPPAQLSDLVPQYLPAVDSTAGGLWYYQPQGRNEEEQLNIAANLHFVVQPPREESDLSPLSTGQWDQLQQQLGFVRLDPGAQDLTAALTAARRGRELWLALLSAVLLLAIAEIALARLWSTHSPLAREAMDVSRAEVAVQAEAAVR